MHKTKTGNGARNARIARNARNSKMGQSMTPAKGGD